MTPDFLAATRSLGLSLTPEQTQAFADFEAALYAANAVMNLTRVPREEAWLRHFLDSLLVAPYLPEGAETLDIGCGPGFPSWPLALARPDLRVCALDSSGKMLGFLETQGLPNLEIVQGRAEEWELREGFDVVTGRAVAPLAVQLEISAALARVGGAVVPMRTANDDPEEPDYEALGLALESVERATLPDVDAERLFPIYRKVRRTPGEFPRRWAEIREAPLLR